MNISRPGFLKHRSDVWFGLFLAVVVLVLYAPSLRFGLIWDDPIGYRRALEASLWTVWQRTPGFPFYRPLAVLLNAALMSPDGTLNAVLAHAIQVGAHLLSTLISVPVLLALDFERWHARLTSLLFAIGPFAFEAVAWQAPMQAQAMLWVLLALLAAGRFLDRRQSIWLALSVAAFGVALLFQECAVPFVFVFFWLAIRRAPDSPWRLRSVPKWPLLHLGAVLIYSLAWLSAPQSGGAARLGFSFEALCYFLQGIVYPVSRLSSGWLANWPLLPLAGLYALVAALLVLGVWKGGASGRCGAGLCLACLCVAWIGAGVLPVWAGLSWAHVQTGARLLYPASLGIAALWAGWAVWTLSSRQAVGRRVMGGLFLIAVVAISLEQWWQFQKLYERGTQHLNRTVALLAQSPGQRFLFVNYPDRIEITPRLYPLGFWGLMLSPVVQNLSDYALVQHGQSAQDVSASAFLAGADERDAWPYRVDMRGSDTGPTALFQLARQVEAVYLTRYRPDGSLELQHVGQVRAAQSTAGSLAALGDAARLVQAEARVSSGRVLTVRLVWHCLEPFQEHDTIFVHVRRDERLYRSADGDSLGQLVPLFVWQPGTEIVDIRSVNVADLAPGQYVVRVGIYNRLSGARYPAWDSDRQRFPDDAVPVQAVLVP